MSWTSKSILGRFKWNWFKLSHPKLKAYCKSCEAFAQTYEKEFWAGGLIAEVHTKAGEAASKYLPENYGQDVNLRITDSSVTSVFNRYWKFGEHAKKNWVYAFQSLMAQNPYFAK